ncbi:Vesicle-associated protein 1-3 [Phytophthora citrophthora]|uniref:Vesicle-associated protein 1-3 n=1 Tax=Phytophthora citrophthora TaxID=4793 RepID=A0AAD9LR39_9STRA|nr:Vesicle-associated protein 1-3 [Phytophthora citrophthora]
MYAGRAVAFKVMTTRPLGYLVRPNQGILNPNSSISIEIILQCDRMLLLDMINDEFLVQSVDVGTGVFDLSKQGLKNDVDKPFLQLWTQKDKQVLYSQKLPCYFVGGRHEEAKPPVTSLTLPNLREDVPVRFE